VKPGDRIRLIKKLAPRLASLDWSELDLTLRQFGFSWSEEWEGDKRSYVMWHLERVDDDQKLLDLKEYLFPTAEHEMSVAPLEGPWEGDFFKLFLTHVAAKKKFVSDVKTHLRRLGIDGFVAHADIKPTKEWLDVIDQALRSCDALAAFLTNGFKESDWTDQEVGYVVARRELIIPINRGLTPYGFISRYQALDGRGASAESVAQDVFEILISHDLTSARMAAALVNRLAISESFRMSIDTMKLIKNKVSVFTPETLRAMEQAKEKNRQVRDAFNVPDAISEIVKRESQ
jgi:hypothetical protein